ncbi:MAG: TlpA family protein disulfide reductase [Bacteroidales bacterium]|nr:TlpA family protein disulfide reductase [Bacteroidales bacterium]
MKHSLSFFFFILIASLFFSCTSKQAHFTGTIENYSGAKVSMMDVVTMDGEFVDLEVASDGSYTWDIDASEPHIYFVVFSQPESGFKLYVEKGMKGTMKLSFAPETAMNVTRMVCKVDYEGDNKDVMDLLQTASYYDAQNNTIMAAMGHEWSFEQYRNTLHHSVDSVLHLYDAVGSTTFRNMVKNLYELREQESLFWFTSVSNVKDADFDAFANEADRNNNENIALLYAMYYYENQLSPEVRDVEIFSQLPTLYENPLMVEKTSDMMIKTILQQMPENIEDVYAAYLRANSSREIPSDVDEYYKSVMAIGIGRPAKDFDMYDASGKRVMLSDLKGKVIYIDVWATWCRPCLNEIPHLENVYQHYRNNKDIMIVSVSIDDNRASWLEKITIDRAPWPQYIINDPQNSALVQNYQINSIPRFLLIDKDGKLLSFNAPRPSDEQIFAVLDQALQQ